MKTLEEEISLFLSCRVFAFPTTQVSKCQRRHPHPLAQGLENKLPHQGATQLKKNYKKPIENFTLDWNDL